MPEIKFCPYCSADVVEHAKFCYECGRDLMSISAMRESATLEPPTDFESNASSPNDRAPATEFCRYCGASNASHTQFCRTCGADLTGAAPTHGHAPRAMESAVDQRCERLNESYLRSGHVVLTPFQITVVNGIECFEGTTRHPNGHRLDIEIYLANSYANAQRFKEQLSSGYQAEGYVTHKSEQDTWMGIFEGTLISVIAQKTSVLGTPTTMVVSTPL